MRLKYRLQRRIFRSQNNTPNKLVRLVLISAVCIADKESNDSTSGKNITWKQTSNNLNPKMNEYMLCLRMSRPIRCCLMFRWDLYKGYPRAKINNFMYSRWQMCYRLFLENDLFPALPALYTTVMGSWSTDIIQTNLYIIFSSIKLN